MEGKVGSLRLNRAAHSCSRILRPVEPEPLPRPVTTTSVQRAVGEESDDLWFGSIHRICVHVPAHGVRDRHVYHLLVEALAGGSGKANKPVGRSEIERRIRW